MNSTLGCIRGDCSYTSESTKSGSERSCQHPGSLFINQWLTRVTCQCHAIKIIITVSRLYIFDSFLDSYLSRIVFFFVRIIEVENLHLNTSVCVFDTTSIILLDQTKVVILNHLPHHLIRDN